MRIAIGADHGGYKLKEDIISYLNKKGHKIIDVGAYSPKRCDYPEIGYRVARLVSSKKAKVGILICKTGLGLSVVANKVRGIRAALCWNLKMVKSSRRHNNANVLCLGALFIKRPMAKRMVSLFISEKFQGGRHARRVRQVSNMEKHWGSKSLIGGRNGFFKKDRS